MEFYQVPPSGETIRDLRQGDLLYPVPFIGFNMASATVLASKNGQPIQRDLTREQDTKTEFLLITKALMGTGLVVSQSCDLVSRPNASEPVVVARVLPCEGFIKKWPKGDDAGKAALEVQRLSNPGKTPGLFYLRAHAGEHFSIVPSVADLHELVALPHVNLAALPSLVKLRLAHEAQNALQERMAYCFGRYGAPDELFYSPEEFKALAAKQKAPDPP